MGETGEMNEMGAPGLAEVANGGWDARVRMFRAGEEVDTFAVVTRRFVVIVDTMATPALAAGIVDALAGDLAGRGLLVVNTHADWDHCWGNAAFAAEGPHPASVVGHELARRRMLSEEARRELAERQAAEARFGEMRLVAPEITFREELRIHGGDLTLELLPTPGHTADHVSVWIPELRLLLAGDAAEHPFPLVHTAEDLPALLGSLQRLEALGAEVVLSCHGGTTDAGLIGRNLAYFGAVERHAGEALAAGGLPGDWRARDDLLDVVGYSYEEALQDAGATPEAISEGYREFHVVAVRAIVEHVRGER